MSDSKNMVKTMISQECKTEAEEVMEFMAELSPSEKKEFKSIIHGARLLKNLLSSDSEKIA